jgi:hypothetical protein
MAYSVAAGQTIREVFPPIFAKIGGKHFLYGHQQGHRSSQFKGTSGAANCRPPEHGTQELYQQHAIDSKKSR